MTTVADVLDSMRRDGFPKEAVDTVRDFALDDSPVANQIARGLEQATTVQRFFNTTRGVAK